MSQESQEHREELDHLGKMYEYLMISRSVHCTDLSPNASMWYMHTCRVSTAALENQVNQDSPVKEVSQERTELLVFQDKTERREK